jgi:hypothetical protein
MGSRIAAFGGFRDDSGVWGRATDYISRSTEVSYCFEPKFPSAKMP